VRWRCPTKWPRRSPGARRRTGPALGDDPGGPRDRPARGREGPPARHGLAGLLAPRRSSSCGPGSARLLRRRADGLEARGRWPSSRRRRADCRDHALTAADAGPGGRPPHRYSGGNAASRPVASRPVAFDAVYRLLMPTLSGPAKKGLFQRLSDWMVVGFGLAGAILAFLWLGPLGAILGLGGRPAGRRLVRRAGSVLPPVGTRPGPSPETGPRLSPLPPRRSPDREHH